jgi:hypothetical protein
MMHMMCKESCNLLYKKTLKNLKWIFCYDLKIVIIFKDETLNS